MSHPDEISHDTFNHRLSHSLDLSPPLPPLPELDLSLVYTGILRMTYQTPSGSVSFDRQEIVRQVSFSCSSALDLLSHVEELPPELRPNWEESISTYIHEAMKGVKAGRVKVTVEAEMRREVTRTEEDEEILISEQNIIPMEMMEASLEGIRLEDCDGRERECAVCLEEFESEKRSIVRILRCEHVFHRDCVVRWLVSNPCCPMCRLDVSGLLKIMMLFAAILYFILLRLYLLILVYFPSL